MHFNADKFLKSSLLMNSIVLILTFILYFNFVRGIVRNLNVRKSIDKLVRCFTKYPYGLNLNLLTWWRLWQIKFLQNSRKNCINIDAPCRDFLLLELSFRFFVLSTSDRITPPLSGGGIKSIHKPVSPSSCSAIA